MTFLLFSWLFNLDPVVEPASPVKPLPAVYNIYMPVVSW